MLVAMYWTQCGTDQMILKKKKLSQRGGEREGISTISQPKFYPSPSSILMFWFVIPCFSDHSTRWRNRQISVPILSLQVPL